jgi:DNA-binding NtrC family response regulator
MEEARKLIAQQSFNLVITDVERPGDSTAGYSLLRWVRGNHPSLPVILYPRGGGSRESRETAQKTGAFLSTDDTGELVNAVANILGVPCGDGPFIWHPNRE